MKAKGLLFNLTSRLGLVTIGRFLAFFTIPIISRALGPEQYGVYSFAIAVANYGFLPADWGFLAKGIRDVAKLPSKSAQIASDILSSRLTLYLLGGIIIIFFTTVIYGFSLFNLYILMAILTNFGLAITLDFFFYGRKDTFTPSAIHLLGQFIFLLLVYVFVENENDLLILMTINIFYRLLESLILIVLFKKEQTLEISFPSKKAIPLFKDNFFLGLGAKGTFFQNSFPILVIPFFLSTEDLGIYSATFKVFMVSSLMLQSMNLVFSPWIVESKTEKNSSKKLKLFNKLVIGYFISGILGGLFLYFIGPLFLKLLFGSEFSSSQNLIRTFSIYLVPIWPIYMILVGYMNNFEKDRTFFLGSLFQITTITILVPIFLFFQELNGVIYGLASSTTIVSLFYYLHLQRELKS